MAKTKALISFAVTAKLICVFVFAYLNCWFSHDAAQMPQSNDLKRCTDKYSVDPYQTAPLVLVGTVCSNQSVRKLRIIMAVKN